MLHSTLLPSEDLTHQLTVHAPDGVHRFTVPHGANLRQTLLGRGFSPYTQLTKQFNCGGNGICATCGVWVSEDDAVREPAAKHWHDRLAHAFGYPRLSCQIQLTADMSVRLIADKKIWGKRKPV
ncbi:MAG: 2Fe-2S iron-sulfur cluster binding domain-containing protein [Rhizobacter sp.]|nr:2Fe-2S iron-sulfur cluster binding domain-containing protein [Chlorobiales bacterium]